MADDCFCFVHPADLHLDTPFTGIGRVSAGVAQVLREASLQAFDTIVDLALARTAAFVLFAGDIYDGAQRGLRAQLRFREGLARLAEAGIPSFVVHGNHDPLDTGWSAIREWPEKVTVFGTTDARVVPVAREGRTIATVQGVSYATPATTENLALRLRRPDHSGVLHVGLLHCAVEGASTGHESYSPCSLGDLHSTGLDYLALGHVHRHAVLSSGPGLATVVYAGTSQARSVRPGELGPKGAVVVHVSDAAVREVEFVACDAVRFDLVDVDIAPCEDLGALLDELEARGRDRAGEADGRSLVLRGRLVGRGAVHGDLRRQGSIDQLLDTLRSRAASAPPLVWWDALEDRSGLPVAREEIRGRGDFAADLVTLADEVLSDPLEAARLVEEGTAGTPPRALATRLGELLADGAALVGLVDEAVDAALDALESGAP